MANFSKKFRLVAHRGGLYYRPENTLAAFENMAEMGIEWVECDVRLTNDQVAVLFHDESLPGHGARTGFVRDLPYKTLSEIDVGGGERIPTVDDFLKHFSNRFHFDIEIKELDVVEAVIKSVKKHHLEDRVLISSFIPEALQNCQNIAPEIRRGLLMDRLVGGLVDTKSALKAATLLRCECFLPEYRTLNPTRVKMAHDSGLKVIPWTVNRLADAQQLINFGVDGLISDRPDYFRELAERRDNK